MARELKKAFSGTVSEMREYLSERFECQVCGYEMPMKRNEKEEVILEECPKCGK